MREYYVNEKGEAVFPEGITEIPALAFSANNTLKTAVIPETVEIVGDQAFISCENLEKVVLPSGLKEIGCAAFESCELLQNIMLPSGLKKIENYAFHDTSLKELFVPDSVVFIGYRAFANTYIKILSFKGINLFENIVDQAFYRCPIKHVAFRENISSEENIQKLENQLWHSWGFIHCNKTNMEVFVTPSYDGTETSEVKKVLAKKKLYGLLILKCSSTFFSSPKHIEYIITDPENPDIGCGIGRNVKDAWISWIKYCYPVRDVIKKGTVTADDYRMITGACEEGVKEFLEKHDLTETECLPLREAIRITKGEWGHERFVAAIETAKKTVEITG